MSEFIRYSTTAKAHDLALLKLKSLDVTNMTTAELTKQYLEIFKEIENILSHARKNPLKQS